MAVQVNFSVSELIGSDGFVFVETTGSYSAGNTNGWGSPNLAWSTAFFAEITIKDYLGNVIGIADTEFQFDQFDSTPSSTQWSTPRLTVLASEYGLTTFADGVYSITYTARQSFGGTVISTFTNYFLFASFTQTQLKDAELQIPQCNDECFCDLAIKLSTYRALLVAYSQAVQAGSYTTAQLGIVQMFSDTANLCLVC